MTAKGESDREKEALMARIVIGVVLGPLIESNLARAMTIAQARQIPLGAYLLSSNLAVGLLVGTVALTVMVTLMRRRLARLEAGTDGR